VFCFEKTRNENVFLTLSAFGKEVGNADNIPPGRGAFAPNPKLPMVLLRQTTKSRGFFFAGGSTELDSNGEHEEENKSLVNLVHHLWK
jgi:hypothetical protein